MFILHYQNMLNTWSLFLLLTLFARIGLCFIDKVKAILIRNWVSFILIQITENEWLKTIALPFPFCTFTAALIDQFCPFQMASCSTCQAEAHRSTGGAGWSGAERRCTQPSPSTTMTWTTWSWRSAWSSSLNTSSGAQWGQMWLCGFSAAPSVPALTKLMAWCPVPVLSSLSL